MNLSEWEFFPEENVGQRLRGFSAVHGLALLRSLRADPGAARRQQVIDDGNEGALRLGALHSDLEQRIF